MLALCPHCGQQAHVTEVTDTRSYLGVSHAVDCSCGLHCSLDDLKSGNLPAPSPLARRVEGYRIQITGRPYRLVVRKPNGDGYPLTMYRHRDGSGYLSCGCPGYVQSLAGTCKHCRIGYQWLANPANLEACKKAWGIGQEVSA